MDFIFIRAMTKLKNVNSIKFKPTGARNQRKIIPNLMVLLLGANYGHAWRERVTRIT